MSVKMLSKQEQAVIDERLLPMVNGLNVTLDDAKISELNYPNYDACDVIVTELIIDAKPYNPDICGNDVTVHGTCNFVGSSFPEVRWEHLPGNLFQVAINQAGKAAQAVTSTLNGIVLRSVKSENKRPTRPDEVTFLMQYRMFVKAKQLFVKTKFTFFQDDKKVAHYETLSLGIQRDYSKLSAIKDKANRIGQRLVSARALTPGQCERLLKEQLKLRKKGTSKLFGELAVEQGYCTQRELKRCLEAV